MSNLLQESTYYFARTMFRRVFATAPKSAVRGFSTTAVRRAGAFSAFLVKAYKTPNIRSQLVALPVAKRGKLLSQWFRGLPTSELEALKSAAKKINTTRKPAPKKGGRFGRKPTAYNRFVAAQQKTAAIRSLPVGKRLAAIAKAWNKK
jgi:hypothetical protein